MNDVNNKLEKFFFGQKLIEYKPKQVIIQMSDEPGGVYYIKEGYVKMNTILANGNELTLNIYKERSFFPMTWAIANIPNNYLFQTITKSSFYKAPKKEVLDFLQNNDDVLFDLTRRLLLGLDGILVNVGHLILGSALSRVSSALLMCYKRFGKDDGKDKIVACFRLTHQDLANISGLTRETTSIAMGQLEKSKIIFQDNSKIAILDLEKLKDFAKADEDLQNHSDIF